MWCLLNIYEKLITLLERILRSKEWQRNLMIPLHFEIFNHVNELPRKCFRCMCIHVCEFTCVSVDSLYAAVDVWRTDNNQS